MELGTKQKEIQLVKYRCVDPKLNGAHPSSLAETAEFEVGD
jgi:hypothetical protein